jgi:hypothetical protein
MIKGYRINLQIAHCDRRPPQNGNGYKGTLSSVCEGTVKLCFSEYRGIGWSGSGTGLWNGSCKFFSLTEINKKVKYIHTLKKN